MTIAEFLLAEFDREVARSRKALAEVPDGKYDWKPHDKSMIFGYLADMVATIPSWVEMQITKDELDIAPADGSSMRPKPKETGTELVQALDAAAAKARAALATVSDDDLRKTWNLKARGAVVQSGARGEMIQDTLNHWAHHRGQMTVYLRLLGAKVPAIFGPSADDKNF
jgi:uncharacterized damage-inducible protein DinB